MEEHWLGEEGQATLQGNNNHNQGGDIDDLGPILRLSLEEDINRKDQLFSLRKDTSRNSAPAQKAFRASEQQLLQQGKLGESEFSGRLQKVVFGLYEGFPACLVLIQVNFCPKSRGWFRFRDAVVELAFEEDREHDQEQEQEQEYDGPIIRKFYPELIRGHVQTAAEKYGISFSVPIPPTTAAVSAEWSVNRPKEGLHLIHGALAGDPETRVKWRINENKVSRGGIFESPKLCVILRHKERKFAMSLSMKATTYGGLPIVGKGGSRITFTPPWKKTQENISRLPSYTESVSNILPGLENGSIEMGSQTWTGEEKDIFKPVVLDDEDLEELTHMRAVLLGQQGPGAPSSITMHGT